MSHILVKATTDDMNVIACIKCKLYDYDDRPLNSTRELELFSLSSECDIA